MPLIVTKYLITAAIIVLVSELAKRSDQLGALVAALPLVTIMVMFWLYFEQQPIDKIANHARYTFWYVIPTLPMFLCLPFLMPRLGFMLSMGAGMLITFGCFGILNIVSRSFTLNLFDLRI